MSAQKNKMKKYIKSTQILAFFILATNYVFCDKNAFVLKSYSEVSGDKIYFKDIVEIQDVNQEIANIEIGKSAIPKNSRIISKHYIYTKLRQAGYNNVLLDGSDKIKVLTKYSHITYDSIFNFVKEYFQSMYQDEVNINPIGKMQDIFLPYGNISLKINKISTEDNVVVVDILVDNKICKTMKVNLKIDKFGYVYFAKRNISKNEVLKIDDFERKKVNISIYPKDVITDEVFFKDKTAKQIILFSQPLRKIQIGEKFLCQKNDTVRIVGKDGMLEVALDGKALQNGNMGDDIKVITSTKKEILAKVKGEKLVEVKFSGGE